MGIFNNLFDIDSRDSYAVTGLNKELNSLYIYNYFIKGDIEKANEAQKKIRPFRNVMQMGNPNSVVKLAVNLRGFNVGPARRPSNCTDPKIIEALKEVFKQY